ncbi:MAG: hypothetical protein KDA28_09350, partial [Phycisphaerales bacterium]|nr:hypothetical protein [Phycisphaerales bacterium]
DIGDAMLSTQPVDPTEVESLLLRFGLPTRAKGLPEPEVILEAMRDDKKVQDGELQLVVPEATGLVRLRNDIEDEAILEAIARPHN